MQRLSGTFSRPSRRENPDGLLFYKGKSHFGKNKTKGTKENSVDMIPPFGYNSFMNETGGADDG